ncbi:MAG UNVERIFIED_CONTAM: hypothetical protein LVR18_12550 [Planctomycetaceae bacterium]|jgi:hypothetical protein
MVSNIWTPRVRFQTVAIGNTIAQEIPMLRQILVAACVLAAACGTADAGDRIRLYHPGFVYAPSPYYVPVYPRRSSTPPRWSTTRTRAALSRSGRRASRRRRPSPVYYSPYAPAPVYYYGGYRGYRRYRGVEIEFERDGDIEIDYR